MKLASYSASFRDLVNPQILTQPVYEGGKPIERVAAEFGLDPRSIAKLASNENFLGPSPKAVEAMRQALATLHWYPDGNGTLLKEAISRKIGVAREGIILGNGSNEVLELMARAFLNPQCEAVFGEHAFIVYKLATLLCGAKPVTVPMPDGFHDLDAMAAAITDKTRLVFLAMPNNPTGCPDDREKTLRFVEHLPDHVILVLDEAYREYLDAPIDLLPLIQRGRKILCTRTFSKIYGLGGLRLGYGYGHPDLIALLNQIREPFNVNQMALVAGVAALSDDEFVERTRRETAAGRKQLSDGLSALGFRVYPSVANFVLFEVESPGELFTDLQRVGVIVRPLGGYGLTRHIRVTVGSAQENDRFLFELRRLRAGNQQRLT